MGYKWVYKVKFKVDGTVKRYKARLVAKEYSQRVGFEFQEIFSPVPKYTTVRTFLALASIQGWHLSQLDINNTFLNGELQEVYIDITLGYQLKREYQGSSSRKLFCKLQKSLYGLN